MRKINSPRSAVLLFLTALIWGVAFVAQSSSMEHVGPFTFLFARNLLGGIVLLPAVAFRRRAAAPAAPGGRRDLVRGGLLCGLMLFSASALQQIGICYTTVGKAGFLTALYILFVPLLGLAAGKRAGASLWVSVALACAGLYLLCMTEGSFALSGGDLLVLGCAVMYACHILVIDRFSPKTDGVQMSCIQFFVVAALSLACALVFEQPRWSGLAAAALPILYAGILSSGVGYTLQIVGQKNMDPTVASLILSLESVNAAWAGWLLLGQALRPREIGGCALMFAAIVLAQLPQKHTDETEETAHV